MKILCSAFGSILLLSSFCFSQNDPVTVVSSGWQRVVLQPVTIQSGTTTPARAVTAENKYFRRKAREQQSPGAIDPNEMTLDGRSAALDRAVQEARTPKIDQAQGYSYSATIRNDSGQKVDVIYWEYRFSEIANPGNTARRQFLCAAGMKSGDQKQLTAFSLIGPSDVIDVDSLAKANEKLFTEEVVINRLELSDGSILQRHGWKFADVKKAVERATSTPWGTETCRML